MRLSPIDRNNLNEAQQTVLEAIERGPRGNARPGIGMIGPFGAWVRAPSVGGAAQALGAAIRFGSSVPENIKEVAICTVGAHFKSKFEFSAHKRLGMQAGLNETQLNQLRDGESPTFE
ncbi:MAG TPA: carboxymuconolactone decarboxylase family protein, partial [Pseudomonadales bacterium]|nr:carboxymuconolactone decarboxylase family protein [Pseudomonadales bacterium]